MNSSDRGLIKREYMEGVHVFDEGDESDAAFLIEKGEVEIFKMENGKRLSIAVLGEGKVFGEMSLIKGTKRSVSAETTKKTVLVFVPKQSVLDKLEKADPLLKAMIHNLIDRLYKYNNETIR